MISIASFRSVALLASCTLTPLLLSARSSGVSAWVTAPCTSSCSSCSYPLTASRSALLLPLPLSASRLAAAAPGNDNDLHRPSNNNNNKASVPVPSSRTPPSSRRSFLWSQCTIATCAILTTAVATTTTTATTNTALARADTVDDLWKSLDTSAAAANSAANPVLQPPTWNSKPPAWPDSAASPLPPLQPMPNSNINSNNNTSTTPTVPPSDFAQALRQSQQQKQVDPRTHG